MLASVVAAFYYLRIVKIMYFDAPVPAFERMPGLLRLVLGISGVINLLFFAYPAPLFWVRRRLRRSRSSPEALRATSA